ncbi:MAG: toll/interleukin-1 receptor domain-containing protein [Thaumarchaeota archaeon]|nr:toll/interleukin-1 receptor domain-containing protein [Nitrososphaerota archaeon]
MTNRVFISYATGDENGVKELYDALSRLQNIEVYIPEWINIEGKSQAQKVVDGLNSTNLVIVLITFNSTNTMWLNQEMGYARARNIPIISVVEKGIGVKGFLEEQQHIIFQRDNFKINVYQVISKMRKIFSQVESPITHFQIVCPTCEKKHSELLPPQEDIDNKIEQGQKLNYSCNYCSTTLYVDPMTFDAQSTS